MNFSLIGILKYPFLFLIFFKSNIVYSFSGIENIVVHYAPWDTHFKGPLVERDIIEMNNSIIKRDTIVNDSILDKVDELLLELDSAKEFYNYYNREPDLRMVCVYTKNDGSKILFSFGQDKKTIVYKNKTYYSKRDLMNLINRYVQRYK